MNPYSAPQNDAKAEPGRYGFGTTAAVEALLKRFRETPDMTAMVAINIATMIRNNIPDKNVKAQEVVDSTKKVMNEIANEIAEICHDKWKDKQHHILFYIANSDKAIPPEYIRPRTSETFMLIDTAMKLMERSIKPADQDDRNVHAHIRLASQLRVPSYRGLRDVLQQFTQPGVDLHLISHMPMDYHVTLSTGRNGWLYRSHTGEIVKMTPSNLGKTVFKLDTVPFYPITHVLLGDKYLLKSPIPKSERTKMIDLATRDRWTMHTNSYVEHRIKENGLTPSYTLEP